MKEVTVGEKLMVNGVLDYISVPNVKGNLPITSFDTMTLIQVTSLLTVHTKFNI